MYLISSFIKTSYLLQLISMNLDRKERERKTEREKGGGAREGIEREKGEGAREGEREKKRKKHKDR